LIFLIVVSFGYSFLKISSNGNEYSYFNMNFRKNFSKSPLLRSLFGLHLDGDGRYDYLGNRYEKIVVAVFTIDKYGIDKDLMNQFTHKISKITGKPTVYKLLGTSIPFEGYSEIDTLQKYLNNNKYRKEKDEAVISLIVADQLKGREGQIGSTLGENGIVLFQGTLSKYMLNENDDAIDITSAVLLHEFGHQLGLEHNNNYGCLMNESSEFTQEGESSDIVVDFCDFERNKIKSIVQ